ncbi:MAG: helix-turn-helix domain-containing protein [Anaerolineales bacterium]|mgnify:FL=1|nr:helix-turn-helix domain-containing protein [Anaerolineales bacterium]
MTEDFKPTEWITTQESAELTGYNLEYIRQMIRRGVIGAEKRGRDWWVDRASIEAYAEEMKRLGPAKHDPQRGHGRR